MFYKSIISLIFSAVFMFSTTANAQPIQEQTLNQLLKLSDITQLMKDSNKELQPFFDAQAQEILKANLGVNELDSKQENAAKKISLLLQQTNQNIISDPKFSVMIKDSFKKMYTEEEAQAYIAFLSTPMGQSINKKSSLVMSHVVKETQKLTQEIMNDSEKSQQFNQKLVAIVQPLIIQ